MSSETMSDDWNFYFCEIDDKAHSTMVNLSLKEIAPIETLSVFLCIEVELRYPNPENGMTTSEESETLYQMEDFVIQSQTKDLKYIARQTGDCKRKFYFYATPRADFESLTKAIGQTFPAYEISVFSFEDVAWETYFEDLYPNAMAMNEITNRAVFLRLEEEGDDLSVSRPIDHFVYFASRMHAKEFEQIVKEKGFAVEVKTTGFLKKSFDLLVQRIDSPQDLDPVTFELEQLAKGLGGSYDGWGCQSQVANT